MTSEELKFFDTIAPKWDEMEVYSTSEKVAELIDLTGIREGYDVLDLGTGTGVLLPELSGRVGRKGTVMAVDFSERMLAEARGKNGELKNVDFLRLDFEKSDVPGRYDLIMLYCVYPHLAEPVETLKRLRKHNLKDGGKIVIGFPKDEGCINRIHADKDVDSDLLPPAPQLAGWLTQNGLASKVIAYSKEGYLVGIE